MSIRRHEELKQLQSRRDKLEVQLPEVRRAANESQRSLVKHEKQLREVKERIADIEEASKELVVSEHALLRYLERVKGVDLEEIKQEMLTNKTQELFETLGPGKYPIEGASARLVVKGSTVVSVVA